MLHKNIFKGMIMRKMELAQVQMVLLDALIEVDRICQKYDIQYYLIAGSLAGAVVYKGFVPWDDDIDIAMMRKDYEKFLDCYQGELNEKYFLQNYHTDVDFHPPITRICVLGTYIDEYYSKHLNFNKGVYLDIFPLDNIPDDKRMQKQQERKIHLIDTLILHKMGMVYDKGPFMIKQISKNIIKNLLIFLPLKFLHDVREKIVKAYEGEATINLCTSTDRYGELMKRGTHRKDTFGIPELLEFEKHKFPAPQRWDDYLHKLYNDYTKPPPECKRIPEHEVYEL